MGPNCLPYLFIKSYPHVVEGYPDSLGEILAEQGDLGVTLTEVIQHDEVGVHPHTDADGLRRRAAGENDRKDSSILMKTDFAD